ncbi:MAG: DNA-formamidopyrimidine glycosylase [Simkania negevensis]|nr:DNA-formamidopyrimidine glycosylase [Simkania negevensis]
MPELPEVATIVNQLSTRITGAKIIQAEVLWSRIIATPDPTEFCKLIAGQAITQVSRRGKWILLSLTTHTLLVHLRMTGRFRISSQPTEEASSHLRLQLHLEDGRILQYFDQRKFGKWHLVVDPSKELKKIGVEPLSDHFTLKALSQLIAQRKTAIKFFLLNQKFITGLGNIYVDEALWEAAIHPQTPLHRLSKEQIKALYEAIPRVLQRGLANKGTSLGSKRGNYFTLEERSGENQTKLQVFRRQGLPCYRCRNIIIKMIVGGRGTHFCPQCQKLYLC